MTDETRTLAPSVDRLRKGNATSRFAAVAVLGLVLLVALPGIAVAQSWLYAANGPNYAVVDPSTGQVVTAGALTIDGYTPADDSDVRIVPTPGGRYVFFHITSEDVAVVVDAETHRPVRSIDTPQGSSSIQFSSMGDRVYFQVPAGRVSLDHRQGSVTGQPDASPEFDSGLVAFNRRATRMYGQRGNHLVYALSRNGDHVADVRVGSDSYNWQISPNFRYLLGSTQNGSEVVIVDEQRARITGRIRGPVVPGSAGFDDGSRELHVLLEGGREIAIADVRRVRIRQRVTVDQPAAELFRDPEGAFHVRYQDGSIGIDVAGTAGRVPLSEIGGAADAALVVLKPGQGFACF